MDLKEKIIGSVITMLSTKFNSTDLTLSTTRMYVTTDKKKARYEHSKLRMCS